MNDDARCKRICETLLVMSDRSGLLSLLVCQARYVETLGEVDCQAAAN